MDELQFLTLTVEEIGQKENRHTIKAGGRSYSFFETKQDSSPTRAFADFQKLGVKVGESYSFGIKESQGEFEGKPITYRNIMVISPPQDFPQQTSSAPQSMDGYITTDLFNGLADRVVQLEAKMRSTETVDAVSEDIPTINEEEIDVKDIPFG